MLWCYLGIIILLLLCVLYFYMLKKLNYWNGKGVVQKKPQNNLNDFIRGFMGRELFVDILNKLYNQFSGSRYAGVYPFTIPTLLLRDPELIKQLCVKEFDHFTDHGSFAEIKDPLFSSNLFSLKGEKWRKMRATLSPSFTSSKMKAMFHLMSECAETFVQHFSKDASKTMTVDMTDVLTRYTNDVIATTAFGIKCNSLEDRENEFYLMGKDASGIFRGVKQMMKFMFYMIFPKIARLIGIKMFSVKLENFFTNLVRSTIKVREENNIVRPDMINLLMEARKGKLKHEDGDHLPEAGFAVVDEHIKATNDNANAQNLTDLDITAQALIFFVAGFDTVSRTMCFIAHELAINPDVQDRLRAEIDETLASCNGKVTYEALTKMKYMDMVISEGLRMWPNAIVVDRLCVKPFTIAPETPDEKPAQISVGDVIWISVISIHHDPQYYPEPQRFDPERFNDENKSKISPYTFMPFGVGPRICIGSRFALLEMKLLFFHILSKFELVPVEKTQIPLKLSKKDMTLNAEKGFWLGFKPRNV